MEEQRSAADRVPQAEEIVSAPINENPEAAVSGGSLSYRIIGEAFNSYVIVERGDVMLLVDKHAAHERIIFEGLKEGLRNASVTSQMLMVPLEVMMTSDEIQTLTEYRSEIEAIGFEFTSGRYTANVTAIPEGVSIDAVPDMLVVIADRIKNGTGSAGLTRDIIFEKALYQASCKAAIKAGREYSPQHIKWIIDKLMDIPDITVCPHGRPVAMELSKKSLDRQFERT
jgi:DNA mismatch repair protein MutL